MARDRVRWLDGGGVVVPNASTSRDPAMFRCVVGAPALPGRGFDEVTLEGHIDEEGTGAVAVPFLVSARAVRGAYFFGGGSLCGLMG